MPRRGRRHCCRSSTLCGSRTVCPTLASINHKCAYLMPYSHCPASSLSGNAVPRVLRSAAVEICFIRALTLVQLLKSRPNTPEPPIWLCRYLRHLSFTPPFAPCKFALKFVVYSPTIAETSLLVMRPSFIVTALFALASTAVATFDKACPPLYGLVPNVTKDKCICLLGLLKARELGCTAVVKKGILGIPYCESTCTSHPQPSGHYGKAKRNQPILGPDGTLQRCPSAMTACPIDPPPALNGDRATATMWVPFVCVKPSEDLYNCGGCSSTGLGISCVDLPGVRGTSCTEGKCTIYTCMKGYALSVNDKGEQECIRKSPRRI
ncbi:hypothetical protein AG1IA_08887 [Rhizoctonia solani AG-1 IA]|uniref:Protein CPL1-like domain-containing protein n=1 Tax=Thanatephorus cucumeris (strain AG1-IA) TaxID=983506 RepID=L8WFU9_THACA|nr:hypothetical protein AG1IA_08887 [Rhizoctonia solani AG-1 IA]